METEPQVYTQDIGDAELSYLLYEGDGPTMIMLHATGFLPWMWHPIARKLAPSWRVIAPYFCDHRTKAPDEGGLSWMVVARDLATFCARIGVERPALVGHSMGGTVLTLAVSLYGIQARGMILMEPIFLPEEFYGLQITVEEHPLASKSLRRKDHWNNREEALAYLRQKPLFSKWDEEILNLYIRYGMREGDGGGLALACSPLREAALFMGGMSYDPWPLLAKISCPTLVLEGEDSENRSYIDLRKAVSVLPSGTYRLVEKAGHLIPMEKPREVVAIIKDYFNDIDALP